MSRTTYIPDRGDLVFLNFTPHAGHEQAGRRPAIVLSPRVYNAKTGLCLVCPITSQIKGYPFEVRLPADIDITGVILSDHVRNVDWKARRAEFKTAAPPEILAEVVARLRPLIG